MSDLPYPPRSGLFAFDLIKLLHRSEAVVDVGLAGVVLVTYVAIGEHREDYLRPPAFWNAELKRAVDMTDDDAFAALRRRCIRAGWLVYHKGTGPRSIGHYWSTIPESLAALYRPDRYKTPDKTQDKTQAKTQDKTPAKTQDKTPEHSHPVPTPVPVPQTPSSPSSFARPAASGAVAPGGDGGGVRARVQGTQPAKVQAAIAKGDLLALVRAFGCKTSDGLAIEWPRDASQRSLGVILCVLWIAETQDRSPIRQPSGLRKALAAWDALPIEDRREAAAKACNAYGVPNEPTAHLPAQVAP